MAKKAKQAIELQLPEDLEEFYREKAQAESRSLTETIRMALEAHRNQLQQPGQSMAGSEGTIETAAVPY